MISTLDLFCGGGGSSWGAKAAGATITAGVDAWDLAADTFHDNFPKALAANRTLQWNSSRRLLPGLVDVDLLIASPECTNHTCALGSMDRDESSRLTALYVLNYVRAYQPRWVVIENVVQMRAWSRYEELLSALRVHYHVLPQVLDAANFGVPQSRRRLFIVCDANHEPPDLTTIRPSGHAPASDIIDPRGTWTAGPLRSAARAAGTLARADRAIATLGEGEPFLIVYYGTDGGGGWQPLDRPLRTMTTLDRFGLVEWTRGGPTLRMLQVSELRRAMGFSPRYKLLNGSRRDKIKLLGNGVCPPVMEAIVSALRGRTAAKSRKAAEVRPGTVIAPQRSRTLRPREQASEMSAA